MAVPTNSDSTNLRIAGEKYEYTKEELEEYTRCATDILYFAENYFYIVTLDHGKQKIKLWDHQKRFLKVLVDPPDDRNNAVVLSSRQSAKTTTYAIYVLWYTFFNEDKEVAILANKEKTAMGILKRIKLAYEMMPRFLKQGLVAGGWNKKTIQFENGCTVSCAATSPSAIRSMSCNCVSKDATVKVRHKVTGEIREIPISDLLTKEYK